METVTEYIIRQRKRYEEGKIDLHQFACNLRNASCYMIDWARLKEYGSDTY